MEMSHFKQLVKNVKPSANGYTACCPAHKDKRPSLSFSENEDGKIMVYCHSGCTFSQIIQSLGITAKDLITSNAPKSYSSNSINIKVATPNPSAVVKSKLHTKNKVQRQIEATYKYYDENNILVYESIKYKPKQFSFRRPDHNKKGQYIYNLINTKLYLYQLVPLISAVKNNQTIHIVEGEKDVDNLMEIGLVATTNPMGASIPKQRSKWLEDFNQYFKGANEVIIIPDNDAVGYNHVINIYNNLTGLIKNIKFGIFKGKVAPKYDSSDLIVDRGISTKEEFYMNLDIMDTNQFINHINTNKPEFNIKTDDLIIDTKLNKQPIKFWEVDVSKKKPKIILIGILLYDYLESKGFYYTKDFNRIKVETPVLVRVIDKIVYETSTQDIIQFLRLELDLLPDIIEDGITKPILLESIMKEIESLFKKEKQQFGLKNIDLIYLEDSINTTYKCFKNGFVEISIDGIKLKQYSELPNYISNKVIKEFDIELLDYQDYRVRKLLKEHDLFVLFQNICSYRVDDVFVIDTKRLCALLLVIGYLCDNYKTRSFIQSIFFTESNTSNVANGRNGKGIIMSAIGEMTKIDKLSGKLLDLDYQFVFQNINSLTNVMQIDDIKPDFDFSNFYSMTAEGFIINKKNKDPLILDFKHSPKIAMTSNYPILINGESDKGRIYIMEINSYYNADFTPKDEFKKDFFDDWDNNEWNIFYNLMIQIIHQFKVYFKKQNKLLVYKSDTIKFNQLKKATSNEFAEFSKMIDLNKECEFNKLYNTFLQQFDLEETKYSKRKFSDNLSNYAKMNGYSYKTTPTREADGSRRVISFELIK